MSRCIAVLVVVLGVISPLAAQAPPRISDQVRAILADYDKDVGTSAPPATRKEAAERRDKRLTELLVEGRKESKPQHGALAVVCMHLRRFAEAAEHCEAAIQENPNNEEAYFALVQALASDKHLNRAEEQLAEALKKFPASKTIPELHNDLYRAYAQLREPLKAANHAAALLEYDWGTIQTSPARVQTFLRNVDQLINAYRQGKQLPQALAEIDKYQALADRTLQQGAALMQQVRDTLTDRKLRVLGELDRNDEALALLKEETAEIDRRLAAGGPGTIPLATRKAGLLQLKLSLADHDPQVAQAARDEYLKFVDDQSSAFPLDPTLANLWLTARQIVISSCIRGGDFDTADKLLDEINRRQAELDKEPNTKAIASRMASMARYLANNLAGERKRAALIGQPYPPIAGATWLNGSPLAEADLKGKVILLDFWAVWCGPCIATFPHLREWQEKYAERGLVIIGVTRRYEFDFDAAAGRPLRVANIAPADEDAATLKFLAHHELKHRIAVMPDDDLSRQYLVTGIPQAVLIDRSGAVRLIKVGSGEANAHAIQAAIEKYLEEAPAAAGGAR